MLVARTLGPSTYGLFAIVTTLTVMATVVAEWGLPLIATRLIAGGGLEARPVLAALLGLRLALGFLAGLSVVALSFAASDSGGVHLGTAWRGSRSCRWRGWARRRSWRSSTCGSSARHGRRWPAGSRGSPGRSARSRRRGCADPRRRALRERDGGRGGGRSADTSGLPLRPRVDRALWRRLFHEATPLALAYASCRSTSTSTSCCWRGCRAPSRSASYDAAYRFMLLGILIPRAIVSSVYALAAELAARYRARFAGSRVSCSRCARWGCRCR